MAYLDESGLSYLWSKIPSLKGVDGVTPHIDSTTGNWFLGSLDTGVKAEGTNGYTPYIQGMYWFVNGVNTGKIAIPQAPYIGGDGYWYVMDNVGDMVNTNVKAVGTNGTNGTNGLTPHIDSTTKNWFIGTTNTGVKADYSTDFSNMNTTLTNHTGNTTVHLTSTEKTNVGTIPSICPFDTSGTVNYYVDYTNGLDTNAGTSGAPFKTFGKAWSMIPVISAKTYNIRIAGDYAQTVYVGERFCNISVIAVTTGTVLGVTGFTLGFRNVPYLSITGFTLNQSLTLSGMLVKATVSNCTLAAGLSLTVSSSMGAGYFEATNCTFNGVNYAISINSAFSVYLASLKGTCTTTIYAGTGSRVLYSKSTSTITPSTSDYVTNGGGTVTLL